MRILYACSEAVPFAKTGGLGDVMGALPAALEAAGHEVSLVLPLYRSAWGSGVALAPTGLRVAVPVGGRSMEAEVWRAAIPGTRSGTCWLVRNDALYDREGLYGEEGGDYADNCLRFVFLSRAVLEVARALGLAPQVVHAHDWQTALVPVYLKTIYRDDPGLGGAGTVLTIHNLAFQGVFWHLDWGLLGLDWSHYNWQELEFYQRICLLKGGIVHADRITTVSPSYAREILTPRFGFSLDGVLRDRAHLLSGILNGIDDATWDPSRDPHLAARFDRDRLDGKARCREALRRELDLPSRPDIPLLSLVGRLTDQKGIDLLLEGFDGLVQTGAQVVVLGTGYPEFERALAERAERHPRQVRVLLGFDEPRAHRIEAGSDIFLMPSRFEPCGLNQLYSMRYGTVPVVHATGGLRDTVVPATPDTLRAGTATGFAFEEPRAEAFLEALGQALAAWSDRRLWRRLVRAGMDRDSSWRQSAAAYQALYGQVSRPNGHPPGAPGP
ncbi:MAG: glycogen synthase GlgA [Planctomycetes bacterium]|nr:glycogen synthase GlgA [Planctomycetota bacterium]